ncbi:MAG: GspE/PulE family protein, partial [Candidatus Omnitrophota bacterium]
MVTLKDRLIKILIDTKIITQEGLNKALETQRKSGLSLRQVLIDQGFVKEEDLISILAKHLFIPVLHLEKYKIDPSVIQIIPERVARQYIVIAISQITNFLTVAMADPLNIFALDDLKVLTGYEINSVISSEAEIKKAIEVCYHPEAIKLALAEERGLPASSQVEVMKDEGTLELGQALQESEKPPIVKIVDLMLVEALKKRASDIHVEPEERDLRIRYRIDGCLHDVYQLPKKNQNAVLARLKIISGLDITEARIPQDGRFKVRLEKSEVDFRVSALPTVFGQKFVLRSLDKSNLSIGLDKLGFSPGPLKIFKEVITKPYGMILVTGPTGSGKSTTLYSILSQLNTPERNIITIEDPVEYQVEGITQIQVHPEIGLDFVSGLRSLLRQSPDTIMIGEIRDSETADIAVKAALTGQLVLSTLHTNDAAGAITRLIDMGVEPFLVASSIIIVCAQRLCRKICEHCKEEYVIKKEVLDESGLSYKGPFYRGKGCNYC